MPRRLRTLLACGGADELDAGLAGGADALLVTCDQARAAARARAAAGLDRRPWVFCRIARLDAAGLDAAAIVACGADGVALESAVGGRDVQRLAARLAVLEAECGLPDGVMRILAFAGDTPAGVLALPSLPRASARLAGTVWRPEPLAAALGVEADDRDGPLRSARMQMLIAAAACRVPILCGGVPAGADAFRRACERARREGFAGILIDDARQVAAAHEVYAGPRLLG